MVRARYPLLAFITLAVVVVGYALVASRATDEALDNLADLQARRLARLVDDVAVSNDEFSRSARRQLEEADRFAVQAVAALVAAGDRLRSQQAILQQWLPRLHADRALLVDRAGELVVDAGPRPRPGKREPSAVERMELGRLLETARAVLAGAATDDLAPRPHPFLLEPRQELFAPVGDRFCLVLLRSEANLERLRIRNAIPRLLALFDGDATVARVEIRDAEGTLVASARGQPARETLRRDRKVSLQSGLYDLRVEINRDEMRAVQRRARTMPILVGAALFLAGGVAMALVFRLQHTYLERERSLRAQMEQSRRLASLGRLTAGVAHEIKNPLNAIRLSVGRLERRAGADGAILDALKASVASITATVEDFMQLVRDPSLAPEDVEPAGLLEEAIGHVRPMADELGRVLEVEAAEGPPARVDRARVREALISLLRNALQAARGRVLARVARDGDTVRFTIDDDGPGVPRAQRREIFEYFFTTKPSGTGLGLSLAHRVAEEHGGAIAVDDGPLGGARFTLSLPASGARFA